MLDIKYMPMVLNFEVISDRICS